MQQYEDVEILLVEDNERDAELTIRALTKGGLANRLLWVKDGQEALDYLFLEGAYASRQDVTPRLVLLDINMPRIDGIQVLTAVKANERTRSIPVVVMTSSQEDRDISRCYDLGANSYVVKPVEFNALVGCATHAGFYWLAVNRTPSS